MAKLKLNQAENIRATVTDKQKKAIAYLYKKAAEDVSKQAKKLKGKDGVSPALRKIYLTDLQKQVDKALDNANSQLEGIIKDGMMQTCSGVVKSSIDFMQEIGLSVDGAFSHVPEEVVQNILTGKVYEGNWSLSTAVWKENKKIHSDVRKVVAQGVVQNKSAYDIAKDIETYVNPAKRKDWEWSKVYPGTNRKVDYGAQRLARTLVSHAYQQSLVTTTKPNPFVTGLKWRSAGTSRTCELCAERDGQVYAKDELPLDHPNGMCTFLAVMDNLKDVADKLGDWVNGEYNPELDKWYAGMLGGDVEFKKMFTQDQDSFLTKYGYSPDNMPSNFSEWSYKLNSADKTALFEKLNLSGNAHPFQEIEKWYNKNLARVHTMPVRSALRGMPKKVKEAFSAARKNAAHWFSSDSKKQADAVLRGRTGEVWGKASKKEKSSLYRYTSGSGPFNRPLRGYDENWYSFKGVGNVDLDNEGCLEQINAATSLIENCSYDFDMWLQRGIETMDGLSAFLGMDDKSLRNMSQTELTETLLGKTVTDEGFTSTAAAKGSGFSGNILNIYAPSGTKMMYAEPFSHYGQGDKIDWDGKSEQSFFGSEFEVILQRGTSYRVTKVEKDSSGKLFIDLDVVAQKSF